MTDRIPEHRTNYMNHDDLQAHIMSHLRTIRRMVIRGSISWTMYFSSRSYLEGELIRLNDQTVVTPQDVDSYHDRINAFTEETRYL